MELLLHDIDQLERIAKELAALTTRPVPDYYEADCAYFLNRIATFIASSKADNKPYLHGKLAEVKTQLSYLLKGRGSTDLLRHQLAITKALGNVYATLKAPTMPDLR